MPILYEGDRMFFL